MGGRGERTERGCRVMSREAVLRLIYVRCGIWLGIFAVFIGVN